MIPMTSSERRITKKLARERRKQLEKAAVFKKGPTRQSLKAKAKRLEKTMIALVRTACVLRDGRCRAPDIEGAKVGRCSGQSERAHFGRHRRARTRGEAPEIRHKTAGSLMLCTAHHRAYDAGKLKITALTDRGCDGPLEFTC
jgi:hypothetical protein